ncbi:M48 family metallopeptidase [Yoonia sp. BS5-3]|uniref:M48 family metallopeptidase n=1 Tax=Yoonia phaeophyticola TaxID=3137369 RepID=A0ABZ2V220_9RHOB
MRFSPILFVLIIGACTPVQDTTPLPDAEPLASAPQLSVSQARANFRAAIRRVEPVAERICREESIEENCNFRIVIDERPDLPANAYQTLDANRRPILVFTVPMLRAVRNEDEIAFVLAHEAAHHIEGHYARQERTAAAGAALLGSLAASLGTTDPEALEAAAQVGGAVAARSYSKAYELEADALGTRIAAEAGYDPLKGAQFFYRIPDPGNVFLGTHPPNAERLQKVQEVAAGL